MLNEFKAVNAVSQKLTNLFYSNELVEIFYTPNGVDTEMFKPLKPLNVKNDTIRVGTSGNLGILITDWKSNKPKNFVVTRYTKKMKKPFEDLPDNALGHYNTQLPFYGKLLLKMLEGTKYENIQLLGCIVVLITDEREYHEYRVSKKTINTILEMDMKQYLTKLKK